VYPAITRVFRLVRAASGGDVSISDSAGSSTSYAAVPNPLPLQLDLGHRDRISASQKYYVHAVVTLGTLAEREVDVRRRCGVRQGIRDQRAWIARPARVPDGAAGQ
jgi:hypothetical protein